MIAKGRLVSGQRGYDWYQGKGDMISIRAKGA